MLRFFVIYVCIITSWTKAQAPTADEQLAILKASLNAVVTEYKLEDFYYDTNTFSNYFTVNENK